jgi:hypothetical protein
MSKVLINNSKIVCPHQGQVQLAATTKLTIGGTNVLLLADVTGKTVSGCSVVTDTNTSTVQCQKVTTATGTASKLTVGGAPVVLDTLTGFTDGAPPPAAVAISVSDAGQSKLTAS